MTKQEFLKQAISYLEEQIEDNRNRASELIRKPEDRGAYDFAYFMYHIHLQEAVVAKLKDDMWCLGSEEAREKLTEQAQELKLGYENE